MQIVTDSAADLAPSQLAGLPIHYTTLRLSLGGEPFTGTNEEFYKKLSETDEYPVTSQAAAGEFAELYRNVAKKDPEILSIHISGGLSGTINSARVGASMVPEAKVTFWDSRTLSAALGWQVEAAGRTMLTRRVGSADEGGEAAPVEVVVAFEHAGAVAAVFALGEVNLVFEGVLPALLGFLPIAYI